MATKLMCRSNLSERLLAQRAAKPEYADKIERYANDLDYAIAMHANQQDKTSEMKLIEEWVMSKNFYFLLTGHDLAGD